MKSLKYSKDISISVENITHFSICVFVNGKEYFLSYGDYPYFILQDKFIYKNLLLDLSSKNEALT